MRFLETLAGALSVALENARQFAETQRLFAESEQRAAELAVVNSIQTALAAELDMQGIYDAVGDKIREIFAHAESFDIRVLNPKTGMIEFPYLYEKGERLQLEPMPVSGIFAHVAATGRDPRHQRELRRDSQPARRADAAGNLRGREVRRVGPADVGEQGQRADHPSPTTNASTRSRTATSASSRRWPA